MNQCDARPLLVGEQNPYGDAPGLALYPEPRGCAGWRLCSLVLCVEPVDYLLRFDRVNLLGRGAWSAKAARERAREIAASHAGPIVLLGARVSAAFGDPVPLWSMMWAGNVRPRFARIPHPSGLCRDWNEPGAYLRARKILLDLEER